MSEDKTVLAPVEVPGMQITFQSPVGPQGKGINFIFGVDVMLPQEALDEVLDKVAASARRQDAFEQLRLDQASLIANRKLLAKERAARDVAQRILDGKVASISKDRRRDPDPTRVAPGNVSAVAQHDQRIFEIEAQILGCEERIPHWKAILNHEEPLDLEPLKMAAE